MHIYGILIKGTDGHICREGMEIQTYRMDLWTQQGKEGGIEKIALTYIHYHV